jgi:hypothetical protein
MAALGINGGIFARIAWASITTNCQHFPLELKVA